MPRKERIRFRNDAIFEEADPPEYGRRPLEWRRSFNIMSAKIRRPIVDQIYSVNDVDTFGFDSPENVESTDSAKSQPVKPELKRKLRISGKVNPNECRDTLYFAKECGNGSGIYELQEPEGLMQFDLVEGEAKEGDDIYAAGTYRGAVFVNYHDVKKPHFCFELTLPSHFIEELIAELRRDPSLGLEIYVSILSFSFEVDDALREWYHRRDLFIHGESAPAPVSGVKTIPSEAEHNRDLAQKEDDEVEESGTCDRQTLLPARDLAPPSIRGIKWALWVIAIVLFLNLLK